MMVFSNLTSPHFLCRFVAIILCSGLISASASAQDNQPAPSSEQGLKTAVNGTGLAVPRFVTLKSDKVNLRVGPGTDFPIAHVYVRRNLPLKVVSEFDVWRKVVDHDGVTGWVHGNMVSLKRYAVITAPVVRLRAQPDDTAPVTAIAERHVVMELQFCRQDWCRLSKGSGAGWAPRAQFWGMLETETLQ